MTPQIFGEILKVNERNHIAVVFLGGWILINSR